MHFMFLYHAALPLFHGKDISVVLLEKNGLLKDRESQRTGRLSLPLAVQVC